MTSEKPWSLTEVFGRSIKGACPLIEEEGPNAKPICVNVPHERKVFISAGAFELKNDDGYSRCYHILPEQDFDMVLPQQELNTPVPLPRPILHAERTITGHGQERGGMRTILSNPSTTKSISFVYFETLPWFLRPYLHTLKATISGQDDLPSSEIIRNTFYRPAVDRHRGTQLELIISVPPASTVTLTYGFEKAILRYTEYPPDANRGFNVAPAVIRLLGNESSAGSALAYPATEPIYLRTTSLLLPLPTPDFSMPYNVIILTSTVMALAFGNIFNLLVRRFVGADEVQGWDVKALKDRFRSRVLALREKFLGKSAKTE